VNNEKIIPGATAGIHFNGSYMPEVF